MEILYKRRKLEKICTAFDTAVKEYGIDMAEKIHQRIDEITSAPNSDFLIKYKIGNCHHLKGNRKNQYAMDLVQPNRLIFENKNDNIQIALIEEIIDYH